MRKERKMKNLVIGLGIFLSGCGLAIATISPITLKGKGDGCKRRIGNDGIWTQTYKNDVYGTVHGTFEQTLTYSGKQGNVIKIF